MKRFRLSLRTLAFAFSIVASSFSKKILEVKYFEYLGEKPASLSDQINARNYGNIPTDETECCGELPICAAQFNWDGSTRGSQILIGGLPVIVLGEECK